MNEQESIFKAGEADQYFLRNKQVLESKEYIEADAPLKVLRQMQIQPKRVLEVGCSNGFRLGELHRLYNIPCVGVEPSAAAIEAGKASYPKVEFHQGTADALPQNLGQFDLVIVNFVLHWVSRNRLFSALSEIDRHVQDGGFLIIGDFYPYQPTKNPYHYKAEEGVFTYKMDYASTFTSSALYTEVLRITFDHKKDSPAAHAPSERRGACTLLRKSLNDFYR